MATMIHMQLSPLDLDEILEIVMHFITRRSLAKSMQVSRRWRQVALNILQRQHLLHWTPPVGMVSSLLHEPRNLMPYVAPIYQRQRQRILRATCTGKIRRINTTYAEFIGFTLPPINTTPSTSQSLCKVQEWIARQDGQQWAGSFDVYNHLRRLSTSLQRLELHSVPWFLNPLDLGLILDILPLLEELRLGVADESLLTSRDNFRVADLKHTATKDSVLYPKLLTLEMVSVGIAFSTLSLLLSRLPKLQTLSLLRCRTAGDMASLWSEHVPRCNPQLTTIGLSSGYFSPESTAESHLRALKGRLPGSVNIQIANEDYPEPYIYGSRLDIGNPAFGLSVLSAVEEWGATLQTLDLQFIPYHRQLTVALIKLLQTTPNLVHAILPCAVFLKEDIEQHRWPLGKLKTLRTRFNWLDRLDGPAGSLEAIDQGRSADFVFEFLARSCPQIKKAYLQVMPQVPVDSPGLRQLGGLDHLEDLVLMTSNVTRCDRNDIEWMVQEGATLHTTWRWRSLERFRILCSRFPMNKIHEQLAGWIGGRPMPFEFEIQQCKSLVQFALVSKRVA